MLTFDSAPAFYVDETTLREAKEFILSRQPYAPKLAIILGSGLGTFADAIQQELVIPTRDIPHYPISTVSGHAGRWIFGVIAGKKIIALAGRVHTYEGYPISRVAFPVHLLAELGVSRLIVTNAAGGLNRQFVPGELMLIDDHINLMFANPLRGQHNKNWGARWPDMYQPYDRGLQDIALQVAQELKITLRRGVLVASKGPSYETAAEVRMFQRLGGDAATMSTVPEVLAAVSRGMNVLGISCITNLCTGLTPHKLDHSEVTEVANRISARFAELVREIVRKVG
jgi:purine-nucleoside phosphorylase